MRIWDFVAAKSAIRIPKSEINLVNSDFQILLARLPVSRTKATGLQTLQNTKGLIDRASDVQIMND